MRASIINIIVAAFRNIVSIVVPILKKPTVAIGIGVAIVALIPSVFFYSKYAQAQRRLSNPEEFAKQEMRTLVATISKLMTLPSDEEPTVATVADVEKLKNQQFFANAENGDKVLLYTNARKAILYRGAINRIIEVAPVNIGSGSATPAVASAQTTAAPPKFALRNGTQIVGLTKTYETELKNKVPTADVVDRDNAAKRDYTKSILIDVSGAKKEETEQFAKTLGIEVGALPKGEPKPTSDFLIIVGSDKK